MEGLVFHTDPRMGGLSLQPTLRFTSGSGFVVSEKHSNLRFAAAKKWRD